MGLGADPPVEVDEISVDLKQMVNSPKFSDFRVIVWDEESGQSNEIPAHRWYVIMTSSLISSLLSRGEYFRKVLDSGMKEAQEGMIAAAREQGADFTDGEVQASHSPFLSKPQETVAFIVKAAEALTGKN